MILFEDLADRAGILSAIKELQSANDSFGKNVEDTNERIRLSQLELIATTKQYRDEIIALNTAQKTGQDRLNGLKDDVIGTTAAYKSQSTALADNQRATDSNNKVITQMQERLKQLQKEYEKLDLTQKNDIKRKKEIERELTQTTRAVNGLSNATAGSSRAMKAAEGSVDALRKSTTDLKNQLNAMPTAYEKGTDKINKQNQAAVLLNKQYQESIKLLRQIDKGQQNHQGNVGNYPIGKGVGSAMDLVGVGSLATGAGAIAAAVQAGAAILEVGQKYERLNLLTENALNNNKKAAAEANALIRNFADHSPTDIETVTKAFNRLVDIGIIPTAEQLTQLSDIAIAKDKTIQDYVEAIADAQQGEFERLKEFSIDAAKSGDKIIFTYKGVRTTVDDNSTAINNYLIALGKVPGVMGATDKLAESFAGRWSTIKDGISGVANDIYQLLLPALNAVMGLMAQGVSVIGTYTTGLRELYRVGKQQGGIMGGLTGIAAGVLGSPQLAMHMGEQAKERESKAGTSELDKVRKQQEAQNKLNDAARKKAQADEKYAKDAAKREAAANKALTDSLNNSKAATETALAANEAAQQDGLISERQFINDRQKITLAGIAERQAILTKAGKTETDDYKKLAADKLEAETKYKRDALKLSLSESKADASKAIAGLGRENEEGSLSDADYVERKRGVLVASLNEQKQILADAGQGQSKLAKELDEQLLEADRDYFKARLKVASDAWKKEQQATKDGLKEIDEAAAASYAAELNKIESFYDAQRTEVEKKRRGGKLSEPEAEKQTYAIGISELKAQIKAAQDAYNSDRLQSDELTNAKIADLEKYKAQAIRTPAEISAANLQIEALRKQREQDAADDKKKLDKEVADNAIGQQKKESEHAIAEIDRMERRRQKMGDVAMEIGQTLVAGLFSINQQETENKLAAVDAQQQYELDSVGNNESAKAAIQKKYDIERKRLKHNQDVANREQALFNIGVSTAQAVMKTYQEFGFPFGIPLALLQAGLGAVQAGIVLATPLPQYFAGKGIDGITNDNYSGPAIAGERGREIWQHDGITEMLDRPTLINVGRNDVIYPNYMTEQMIEANAIAGRTNRQTSANKSLGRSKDAYQTRQFTNALRLDSGSIKALAKAIGEENGKLPFNHSTFDERGVTDFTVQQNTRVIDRSNKHRFIKKG